MHHAPNINIYMLACIQTYFLTWMDGFDAPQPIC